MKSSMPFILLILIHFLGISYPLVFATAQMPLDTECGIVNEIIGDERTRAPWTAAIFHRNNSNSEFKFLAAGIILSPSLVLTVFRNLGKYSIPSVKKTIVAVGMKSNRRNDQDMHSQFSQVTYILPYMGHSSENQEYHYYLFHLKTELKFTYYVRSLCLPSTQSRIPDQYFIGGFGFNSSCRTSSEIKVTEMKKVSENVCNVAVRSYQIQPSNIICGSPEYDASVVIHGSSIFYYIEGMGKWYSAGIAAIVRRRDVCHENTETIYFVDNMKEILEWINRNLLCGANKFTCRNGECLESINSICDVIKDCTDASDEHENYCNANKRCGGEKNYDCHLNGKCIRKSQVCDGIKDCPNGSDELQFLCNMQSNTKHDSSEILILDYKLQAVSTGQKKYCHPLQVSEGVEAICTDRKGSSVSCDLADVDTEAILTCVDLYKSSQRVASIKMKCGLNGLWSPYKPFNCEPECGIIGGTTLQIFGGFKTNNKLQFPWHAALFEFDDHSYQFTCGATLIGKHALLTAAHCVTNNYGNVNPVRNYRVVLAPISSSFEENKKDSFVQILDVEKAWIPAAYNPKTLQGDIAVIQLKTPAELSVFVKPVCYLLQYFSDRPSPGTFGKVVGLGIDESGNISKVKKYANIPLVADEDCKKTLQRVLPLNTFCAGLSNGTAVCKGDSGGGLVFKDKTKSQDRYVIKGIVSHAEVSEGGSRLCNLEKYAVFTEVDQFRTFIEDTVDAIDASQLPS